MQDKLFKLLSFCIMITFVAFSVYFGVFFDLSDVAIYLVQSVLPAILSFTIISIIVSLYKLDYQFAYSFTRQVTLQRIDPLLN